MKIIAWPAFKNKYQNPYNWLLYSHIRQQGVQVDEFSPSQFLHHHYDIFHLHWPAETIVYHPIWFLSFVRALTMLILINWARFTGTRIVWTIHDKKPHQVLHPKLANWFQSRFVQCVDGYITLCQDGKEIAEKLFPLLKYRPCRIISHGHYREVYPNQINIQEAREKLNLPQDGRLAVFLGLIRPYKNVIHLIRMFRELDPDNWILIIAGMPKPPELEDEVVAAAANDDKIKLILQFLPDDEIQVYLKAADLVILPFSDILNSGSALLALSFDRPILVSNKGAMNELKSQVGENWVKLYSGELTPAILQDGLNWSIATARPENVDLDEFDWNQISQQTLTAYREFMT
jgi:beta-1,4-mannosyltransferase